MRRLISKSLMPASIAKAKEQLTPLQVECHVESVLLSIVYDARESIFQLGGDPTYIKYSVDACNAFNKESRATMLW